MKVIKKIFSFIINPFGNIFAVQTEKKSAESFFARHTVILFLMTLIITVLILLGYYAVIK